MFSGIGGAYVMQGMSRGLQDFGNEIRQGTEDRRRRKREDDEAARLKIEREQRDADRLRQHQREDFGFGVQQYDFGRQQLQDQRIDSFYPTQEALQYAAAADQMGQYAVNPQLRQYSVEAAGLANEQARGTIGLQSIQRRLYGINADRAAAEFNEWGAVAPMRQEAAKLGLNRARREDRAGGIQMSDQERAYDLRMKSDALNRGLAYAEQTGDFSPLESWFETAVMDGQSAKIRVEGPPDKSVIRVDVIGKDGKLVNTHSFTDIEQVRAAGLGYLDPSLVPQQAPGRWRAHAGQDAVILYDQNTGQAMPAINPQTGMPFAPRQQQMPGFGIGMMPGMPGGQQPQADEFSDLF